MPPEETKWPKESHRCTKSALPTKGDRGQWTSALSNPERSLPTSFSGGTFSLKASTSGRHASSASRTCARHELSMSSNSDDPLDFADISTFLKTTGSLDQ